MPDTQLMLHTLASESASFRRVHQQPLCHIGLGASQELPWPGKRTLRAEVADFEAESARAQSAVASRPVIEQLKMAYFKLAYLQQRWACC